MDLLNILPIELLPLVRSYAYKTQSNTLLDDIKNYINIISKIDFITSKFIDSRIRRSNEIQRMHKLSAIYNCLKYWLNNYSDSKVILPKLPEILFHEGNYFFSHIINKSIAKLSIKERKKFIEFLEDELYVI